MTLKEWLDDAAKQVGYYQKSYAMLRRLADPDPALVEAVVSIVWRRDNWPFIDEPSKRARQFRAKEYIAALSAALMEPKR
jgi:hypothetical protein